MGNILHNDLTGKTFSYLTVICRSCDIGNGKKPVVKWECQCRCGNITAVKSYSLLSGHTISCGCQKIKHGFSHKERLYDTWKNMRRRCNDPKNKRWENYGGKGISICLEWQEYQAFRDWSLANGYRDDLTIDRINVDGNYEPSNCRWATAKQQANNSTRNHNILYDGKIFTMAELADKLGLSYSAIQHRIERGWTLNRIASQMQRRRSNGIAPLSGIST